ncbi:MAG: hypothetical protein KF812_04400 [Fimbriimonadaceae bacterium]|nr:hypothetical protein [Fimbriimonadaceae bacterium]
MSSSWSVIHELRQTALPHDYVVGRACHDGRDTRVATTQNSVSRTFKRDGEYVTDPVIGDGAAKYTPSISERRGTTTTFLHSGMKNADAQTNTGGTVSASRVYDAFGAELSSTGTWQGRFGYAGGFGYQEDDGGFKLLGPRYYDPSTARFEMPQPSRG